MWVQPVATLHPSVVQTLPSEQLMNAPAQLPFEHMSFAVQALWSLHGSVLGRCVQPVTALQPSSVHALPSSQLIGVPAQLPPAQTSFVVQALPSSHGDVLFACVQPLAGEHPSVVQTSPSLQLGGGPPAQLPPEHVSLVVHALPSSQGSVFGACVQPVSGSHPSVVQISLSLQSGPAPGTQPPPAQWSPTVHALPSSQGSLLFTCVQPVAGLQPSSVQPFVSSQFTGSLTHWWFTHRSFVVQ
jgi:hypothetical protein